MLLSSSAASASASARHHNQLHKLYKHTRKQFACQFQLRWIKPSATNRCRRHENKQFSAKALHAICICVYVWVCEWVIGWVSEWVTVSVWKYRCEGALVDTFCFVLFCFYSLFRHPLDIWPNNFLLFTPVLSACGHSTEWNVNSLGSMNCSFSLVYFFFRCNSMQCDTQTTFTFSTINFSCDSLRDTWYMHTHTHT